MKKTTYLLTLLLLIASNVLFAQSIDENFPKEKMRKDFLIFKNIRLKANSGLYKYRTKKEIDSIYNWADQEINRSSTYRDFYNIISKVTDFEGSLHNGTALSNKVNKSLKNETNGYFPYPIKWIDSKWIVNYSNGEIPIGAEILSINSEKIEKVIKNLHKYYTTDGVNLTGKMLGINVNFGKYYRLHYGLKDSFKITYKEINSNVSESITLSNVSYKTYSKNFKNRYSKPFDSLGYKSPFRLKKEDKYDYRKINKQTGILTINTFLIGWNAEDPEHKTYLRFLDSIFSKNEIGEIENLIVDVRLNGGGTDPNDLVTYSYLTNRDFSENKQAWQTFIKVPYLKYIDTKVPAFLRFLGVIKHNKYLKREFYIEKETGYYQGPLSEDHEVRTPNKNAFKGNIYLLISPKIASAGSLFAAMVAGNQNTTVIGEETQGGYFGHNGHSPVTYILPKSKIKTTFSLVNLEQDVPKKENQIKNRGIIPDHYVTQTFEDYLSHKDTQMNFVLKLIKKNEME